MTSGRKMLIIGGTGGTGSQFALFFKARGFDVSVWGPSKKVDLAEEMGVRFAMDLDSEIRESDVVLVSVPIDMTTHVIEDVAPKMKDGSLLMDVTSLKSGPMRAMTSSAPPGVEVIGTHPMFGPTMPAFRGQTIILTPAQGRCERWLPLIRSLYEEEGASVEVLTPEEHDQIMAVVQALTHFAYIGIGSALRALDFDVEKSRRFMSPVYEIMIDLVGRILDQSPELYASIQENPLASKARRIFIDECERLCDMADSGDLEGFKRAMTEAAEHYGETDGALQRSDRMINGRIREKER